MKTDTELQQDVITELRSDPSFPAASIGVTAKNGVVTLSGEVPTTVDKLTAERLSQRVPGVKALAVDLKVTSPGHRDENDAGIARCVEAGLTLKNGVHPHALMVLVENGTVTLTGEVETGYERQAAIDSVRYLRGVIDVVDNIAIKPAASENAIRGEIGNSLTRTAAFAAAKISVSVNGDEVTLSGPVRSWTENQSVVAAAADSPGVRHVVDRLTIEE